MPLHLTIENETSLPDGGPLSVTVTSQRGIDIGRDQYLDWVLPDPTRFISGKHCEIRYSDGQYWLRDVSTNGTFVNRNEFRIDGAHALRDGDRLEIGRYIINVRVEPDGADAYGDASAGGGGAIWDIGGDAPPPINPNELRARPAAANGPDFLDWAADLGSAPPPMMPPPQPYPVQAPPPPFAPPPFTPPPPPPMAEPAGWAMPAPARPAAAPAPAGVWSLDPAPALDTAPPPDPLPPPPPGYEPAPRPPAMTPAAAPPPAAPAAAPVTPAVDFGPAPPPGSRADVEPAFAPVAAFPEPPAFAPPEPVPAPSSFTAPPVAAPPAAAPAPLPPAPMPPAPMPPAQAPPPTLPRATGLPDAGAEFIARFARSAGLPEDLVRSRDAAALADLLGLFVRLTADNLRQLHAARAQSKGAMRSANVTMIQLMDNNPLRFSPTTDDALRILFGPPTKSYLDAPRTLDNSFADLKKHQLQVFAAMQTALRQLLADLDPKSIEGSVPADKGVGALLRSREARLWDHYQTMWKARAGTSEHGMLDVFMRLFADAYDKA